VSPIVPRWEWRAFAETFADLEDRLAADEPEPGAVEDSDEVYVLSLASASSVKVRGGQMDVKELVESNADGLEQWRPILKAEFPLSAADTAVVLGSLGVEPPALERDEYTLDRLLGELVDPRPELRAVRLHKHRAHHTVGGCMAELSSFGTDAGLRQTLAVESTDAAAVAAAVRDLGFETQPNVNVPRGLKLLVGFGMRRGAVIDVGTNSVKFVVGDVTPDGRWTPIVDRAEVTRLGEGLADAGELRPTSIERTVAAVVEMVDEARGLGASQVVAVGTAGLRLAANSATFLDEARDRAGIEVEVIPGEEEARLAYLATRSVVEITGAIVVFDTGGGSTQLTFGSGDGIQEQFSVPVGAARYTERFGLDASVDEATVRAALDAVAADLSRLDGRPRAEAVIGMGGTLTNLAAVEHGLPRYDPKAIHGTVLDAQEVERQIELYRTRDAEQRRELVGLQPKRAEVILAGACIVRTVLAKLGADSVVVSDRGLRHQLLVERFGAE
jgi:exopolyphosphatase/guanosine-5'-triphosphate,3'-diphosphate pyrophosphatase